MKLSMYTCYARELGFSTPTEAFGHFRTLGVRYADIVDTELDTLPLGEYCDALGRADMTADAVISTADTVSFDCIARAESIKRVKALVDGLAKHGIPYIMLAPSTAGADTKDGLLRMRDIMVESFGEIAEYAKARGVIATIENQSSNRRADSKIADLRYILDSVTSLKFVLDSGNFFCVGEDALEAYGVLSDRTVRVHIKDWKYSEDGYMVRDGIGRFSGCAIGDGILPNCELLEKMEKCGFDGRVVLEVNAPQISLDMLDRSANFLAKIIRK